MGLGFIDKYKPELKSYQNRYFPSGSSLNKSPSLLRNTFNLELFRFFNKKNKKAKELKNEIGRIEV